LEKLLPQNIEAECGVLGSIIIDPEAIIQVSDFLQPEDFYRDAHRTIYEVILHLYHNGNPADFITICDELERHNRLDDVGGASYISSLINQVPTSGNVEFYGHIVERTATLRRLIHAAGQIAAVAYEESDADIALDKAEQLIFAISQRHSRSDFASMGEILINYMPKLEHLNARRGSIVGVASGFTDLDRMTGGLQKSDLIILAARPGVGKCLTAHTLIDDPATGERLTIEECVKRKLPGIYGLSEQGKVRKAEISAWIDSGIKPCYRVHTQTGREVEVTGHHPFLTVDGWTPLHDLKVGDSIAIPRQVPVFGNDASWPMEKVRLLAYSMAEGGLKSFPSCVWQWSRSHLAEFLRTLTSCDGSIFAQEKRPLIEFTLASRQLALDLHHAFVRFGIVSRFCHTSYKAWRVEITSAPDIKKYQEEIGWFGKKVSRFAGNTIEVEPHLSDHDASPDIYWDHIAAIEPIGEHQVYDLTVPDGNNFIAQDIFVHNTSFALSLAHNAALQYKHSVAIFSLEMSKEQLAQRLLSMDAGIDQQRLRTGWIEEDEWKLIVLAGDKLSEANIWIDDTAGISSMEMRSKARRLQAEHGVDLIIVDYLQLMQSNANKRNENRVQEVSEISRNLKGLARELNVPVLALSQLSRSVESRQSKVPQLSDLRESGCIAGDSLVYLPDTGTYKPIAQLVGQTGFRVLALNTETWQLEPREVTNAFATGRKSVYRLTTRLERTIRATANHKFLTFDGWKELSDLTVKMHIALPRQLQGPLSETMSDAESDIYWDTVISIEPDREEEVYDLTVDEHHNFVANNILLHNSLEQDSDIVMFIYRDDVYNQESEQKNIANIIVAKHRNGPVGEVGLYFQPSQTRFRDLEATRSEE
jgi:replicative DNA helicase